MALRDQPYIPLYIKDFITDEKLAECSASAHGVYIRLMCLMHKSEHYGKILLKQKHKQKLSTCHNFAIAIFKQTPFDLEIVEKAIDELVAEGVLIIEGDFLVQKRMVKDFQTSEARSQAGKKGSFARHFAIAKPLANDVAPSANENANEDLLINNGEVEFVKNDPEIVVEVVPAKNTNPVTQVSMLSFLSVEACMLEYFNNNSYAITRQQLGMNRYVDENMLREWAEAFNRDLISRGDLAKTLPDWMKHFKNWLGYQDMNKNPLTLHHEQKLTHESGTKPGRQQGLADFKSELGANL
jgi:hypothetical protein